MHSDWLDDYLISSRPKTRPIRRELCVGGEVAFYCGQGQYQTVTIKNIRVDKNGEPLFTVERLDDKGDISLYVCRFCELREWDD